MYAINKNPQAIESRKLLKQALITLMKTHDFANITVTQLAQEAKVTRQTFYRNFDSKKDVLNYYFHELLDLFFASYSKDRQINEKIASFFRYVYQNKEELSIIYKNGLIHKLDENIQVRIKDMVVNSYISKGNSPRDNEYLLAYIASTVGAVLSTWIKNDYEEDIEQLMAFTKKYISRIE